MNVYLSDKEIDILIDVVSEWIQIMSDGEETFENVNETLDRGLGHIMYKLTKGRIGNKHYADYSGRKK